MDGVRGQVMVPYFVHLYASSAVHSALLVGLDLQHHAHTDQENSSLSQGTRDGAGEEVVGTGWTQREWTHIGNTMGRFVFFAISRMTCVRVEGGGGVRAGGGGVVGGGGSGGRIKDPRNFHAQGTPGATR
jgi:hypothetical protein